MPSLQSESDFFVPGITIPEGLEVDFGGFTYDALSRDFDVNTPKPHIPFIFGHELGHLVLFTVAESQGRFIIEGIHGKVRYRPRLHTAG